MTRPALRWPISLCAVALLCTAPLAGAEQPAPPLDAAARVRASIPAPVEPEEGKPGPGFSWEADLVAAGERAGSFRASAEPGVFRGEPVWIASETLIESWGGSTTTTELSVFLARDLSLVKGEWLRTSPDGAVRLDLRRDGETLKIQRTRETEAGAGAPEPFEVPLPQGATIGRAAMLLFLRHAPAREAVYEFPVASLGAAVPTIDGHEAAGGPNTARVEVRGPAKFGTKPHVHDTWLAVVRVDPRVSEFHLEPKTRAPVAIVSAVPPGSSLVPKGEGGTAVAYDDDRPATSWRAAFLKFGHGYHQAVDRWIVGAIHWESLHASDVASGSWPKERGVEELRDAYVKEFLARSKHRPRADADALLRMTLATAQEKTLPDGTIVLSTHPEFGGNVFHFRPVDGVWYVVGIEQ